MAFDKLIEKIIEKQNPTVAGLDPALDLIPNFIKERCYEQFGENLKGAAQAVIEFNKGLIDALYEVVPAVKPQLAFYEALGSEGVRAFAETADYAHSRAMYVIADAKRGDIGSTAAAYAQAFLSGVKIGNDIHTAFHSDALTVNAYLGSDGVLPFTQACREKNKGIFVLVKTSNPSSGELQDRNVDDGDIRVYELMGKMVHKWGGEIPGSGKYGYNGVGAVIGATYPAQIREMREKLPNTFFLIPGYGAQGGIAEDITAAFDKNGLGGIVNSSRGIIAAYKKEGCPEEDYAGAAYREAVRMKEDLMNVIGEIKI